MGDRTHGTTRRAGRRFGRDRVLALWVRLPLVEESDFRRTEAWFERHGEKAVLLGRMVPLFRSLISIPAGTEPAETPSEV